MRLRNIPGAREAVGASSYCVLDAAAHRGCWRSLFAGARGLSLEIGSGKGRFLTEMAARYPDTAFLGIERYETVIYKALKRLEKDEQSPDNLRFLPMDAALIESAFDKGEVDRIYLNFSDPWPKERHAIRRLTGEAYLRRYDTVLAPDGSVSFKTDNRALFDWSLDEVRRTKWRIEVCTYDLHADDTLMRDNVMTEYEERFSSMGHPICKYVIRR